MIDERIFAEILEQPWDGMIPAASAIPAIRNLPQSPLPVPSFLIISLIIKFHSIIQFITPSGQGQLEGVVDYLEMDLQFLLKTEGDELPAAKDPADVKAQLMTALDVRSEREFQEMVDRLSYANPRTLVTQLRRFKQDQQSASRTPRGPLNPQRIRQHFDAVQQAVPKSRIDLWKMLSRALIRYERILQGRNLNRYKQI